MWIPSAGMYFGSVGSPAFMPKAGDADGSDSRGAGVTGRGHKARGMPATFLRLASPVRETRSSVFRAPAPRVCHARP